MQIMGKPCLEIVAALIEKEGDFLLAQRLPDDAYGSYWEFPGGSIEPGETPEEALRREMQEELGVDVTVGTRVAVYEDESPELKIRVALYECLITGGEPLPLECSQVCWLALEQMAEKNLAPADKKALMFLRARKNKQKD
jgi:mutator protein MutT